MKLSFRVLAVATAVLCVCLALVWLFAPRLLLSLWGVDHTEAVALIGRRGAALFLAVGVMFYMARGASPSSARSALLVGLAAGCTTLAALGIFEFAMGRASSGIFVAVITEVLLAAACVGVALAEKEQEAPNKALQPTPRSGAAELSR